MKISAMILVGHYEPYIHYCLDSIKDIVDEVVMLLPHEYEDKPVDLNVYVPVTRLYQPSKDIDFALWRNMCLEFATGDWILWLDADEILAFSNGSPVTRKDIEDTISQKPDVHNFSFLTKHFLYTYFWLDGKNNGEHWSMRLFKNDGRRFTGKIHESLPNNNKEKVGLANPQIWHFGHCKGMEDLRQKYEKTGKVPDNPYGMRGDNDKFCSTHELFRGTRPMIWYNGSLPKVMRLW